MQPNQTVLTAPRAARLRRSTAVSDYDRQGYLIIADALSSTMITSVRAEATAICRGLRGEIDGVTPARDQDDDAAVLRRYLCIHFPHKVSSQMLAIARLPAVIDLLTAVIGPNVKMMQSMLFIKSEGKPGQAWHQNEAHIPTRDRSLTAVWIALDAAAVENGCLWVIPAHIVLAFCTPFESKMARVSTAPRKRMASATARRTRCLSSYPLERRPSSMAICCTDRYQTRATTGCDVRSSITT
jgi:hypothetical protein